jgi:hypothetical protein
MAGRPKLPALLVKTCTDCAKPKPVAEFVPISGTLRFYGRCKACRNARARARYWSMPEIRAAEIARAWKNKVKRRTRRSAAVGKQHASA